MDKKYKPYIWMKLDSGRIVALYGDEMSELEAGECISKVHENLAEMGIMWVVNMKMVSSHG
jgi:hypothetical protein